MLRLLKNSPSRVGESVTSTQVKRCFSVGCAGVWVGAHFNETTRYVAVSCLCCEEDRCFACMRRNVSLVANAEESTVDALVWIGACTEEFLNNRSVTCLGRSHERCGTIFECSVSVLTGIEKKTHGVFVARTGNIDKGLGLIIDALLFKSLGG